MTDPTRAAYESALHKLNELSGRLAIGRENDDYLHRLANAAQNVAIAAREVYAEAREKDLLCSRKSFSPGMGRRKYGTEQTRLPAGRVRAGSEGRWFGGDPAAAAAVQAKPRQCLRV